MYRYEVPIDDQPHIVHLATPPMAAVVNISDLGPVVEFWAEHDDNPLLTEHIYQVYGTGHPLPGNARWAATCPRTNSGAVFHLDAAHPAGGTK